MWIYYVSSVQQPEQEEARNAPESKELQPIQADWDRPDSITACSQQFKKIILTQERNEASISVSLNLCENNPFRSHYFCF